MCNIVAKSYPVQAGIQFIGKYQEIIYENLENVHITCHNINICVQDT